MRTIRFIMMMKTRGERHWVVIEKMMTYEHDQTMNP